MAKVPLALLAGPLSNEELGRHPLLQLPLPRQPAPGGLVAVTPDARVAEVISALEAVGISCLVMGGHAVRFYGLQCKISASVAA